jgi:hypothetical protein
MVQNIIGRFFSSISSSIVEIASPTLDEMQAAQGFWIPEANTPGNYSRVIPVLDRVIPSERDRVIPSNLNPTSHPLQALSPEAGPGQHGIDGLAPRSFHKVEQLLGRMDNPPQQRNPPHTDEESATSQGRKIQDRLQKRRPGMIKISKITLPTKRVTFQDQSNSQVYEQGQTLRAGCDWMGCGSPLLSAPSLDSPVRPASSLAASDRLRHECNYEEAVAAAVRTAQLAAAATRVAAAARRTSKVGDIKEIPCGAWGSVEDGTFVTCDL